MGAPVAAGPELRRGCVMPREGLIPTIDWYPFGQKWTTSKKLDDACSQAPVVLLVPQEHDAETLRRLVQDWRRAGVPGSELVEVRLGGTYA